ncbi:phosphatidylinositol 4-kinase-like protein STT4 [Trichodelitschia bisporula]|uniref:1-phosphatidylinositol 4-kinase n=1 Tax=Trichodelitschia bisporula TaxID=703511 RepID=A0A6G1IAW0_9PEZI|nr:phosphatidylinositol 4-kinase-like protein STT4 [Trichodelitschia bisporula]
MRTLRRDALEKLALLSASAPAGQPSDITRLCRRCPGTRTRVNGTASGHMSRQSVSISRVPMSLPEIEALLGLCKAAPQVSNIEIAAQLLPQLTSYLPEAHLQILSLPPGSPDLDPSPWEPLTFHLTSAVLALGLNHVSLRQHAAASISRYISSWADNASEVAKEQLNEDIEEPDAVVEALSKVVKLAISLLGFLTAASRDAHFWTAMERLSLVKNLRKALSERFMIVLETALSLVRNARHGQDVIHTWKHYYKRYAASGRPLGAMLLRQGFMQFVVACSSLQVLPANTLKKRGILEALLNGDHAPDDYGFDGPVDGFTEIAVNELNLLEEGSDYLQLGSAWQQRLASAVKAEALKCFLCCSLLDDDVADKESLIAWLESTMGDPVQIADEYLASVIFKSTAILARSSPSLASSMSRLLPRIIVQGGLDPRTASAAANCLAFVLRSLPQDATMTTLYSLGNILSGPGTVQDRAISNSPLLEGGVVAKPSQNGHSLYHDRHTTTGSVISLGPNDGGDEYSHVHVSTIEAIVSIACSAKESKTSALAMSMLLQKIGRINHEVDAKIITEAAFLGRRSAPKDFRSLLKMYSKLCHDGLVHDNLVIVDAVMQARIHLSKGIKRGSELFDIYLLHLLDEVVSKGDTHEDVNSHQADFELASEEIAQLLQPLATFVISNATSDPQDDLEIEGLTNLQRNAWFNAVVHGFSFASPLGKKYRKELQVLASYSQPLVAEDRADQLESDIELNTTLRRKKSAEHAAEHKRHLIEVLPTCGEEIRAMNYSEVTFLTTAYLVEMLRAASGDCTKVLGYFLDPRLNSGPMAKCMLAIAMAVVSSYLAKTSSGKFQKFTSPYVAQQLAQFFAGCCHRLSKIQEVAFRCADLIIERVPSSLCEKSSLFALLELLTIMWSSCLEQETDEYEWRSTYTSKRGNVTIELSDDYDLRRTTLVHIHGWAKTWLLRVIDIAPLDVKGLIQTYLSEYDDDGAYGHVSLGRSFALEMGGVIPTTDQRLGAIESQPGVNINTASDFIAQYTTRQEYRFVDGIRDSDQEWVRFDAPNGALVGRRKSLDKSFEDANSLLADMETRTLNHKHVSIGELRDVLRRAGAMLCRTNTDQGAIVHHLVGIPFAVFTKQSIKLGISLWMGVIKENARMESRILAEIAECWEATVRMRRGLFDPRLHHFDPFDHKNEFAPSDRELIARRQHAAYDMIAPHLRLVQFLSSHFNAKRLGTPHIYRMYTRLISVTLDALAGTKCHPLAREAHFHIVLLGLRILQWSTDLELPIAWRFKDRLLSAGLAWFASRPQWTYGGNRLQVKAETHLLADIQLVLDKVRGIGYDTHGSRKSLQPKHDLLSLLLANEQTRLLVWLFPLDYERKHHFTSGNHSKAPLEPVLAAALKTAWVENPSLAVHFPGRFQSSALTADLRFLLLTFPEKVLNEPDALECLLGQALPDDVSFQLKYLLYWAPVNPITAVSYFLPAYGNHPFIIQYAVRALDHHSVDVTFFYVPQIVQTLRYDVLGYVERYIIEAAKFSQLFAHQIIWNIKANAYKDEDSQIPDPVKPILDKVMDSLVSSFSPDDRDFYEREFSFFNEVTDISGKLRPFIKKSKPEKKQKIEEELRKIKVEVGVYLPSNPDGVVIGIDRKSGKPLQSHAKAPYMATFRIRKERNMITADGDELERAVTRDDRPGSYEVWQSAIFKVGDDCRQDVLALQMIAAFRGIFHSVGLDVYVFPYRVTATAPGCGVIDVLPNSISRDMLGREAVNGLHDYFTTKYGGADSIRYQEARNNFVKSMAAYSVISFLLQFKDRHNGNIMVDDAGHILHVDFGFCFDIVPGGVKFERAPFKLTAEMVAVMGGTNAQAYRWFEELCVKAFLAARQHAEHLVHMVVVMLDSGLPCFKPTTIQHFRERFVLEKSEREAADFMRELIKRSLNSVATRGYDHFQLLTNGIPY